MSALPAVRPLLLDTRVLLADEPGVSRSALARVLAATPGVELVRVMAGGRALHDAVTRLRPDVLVIDDRLLRHSHRLPCVAGLRVIVVGVDDDPAYAARAVDQGAVTWLPKERADLLIPALFDPPEAVGKYGALRGHSPMTGRGTARNVAGVPSPRIKGDPMPTTIVIGSDGSAQSDAALRFGGALARALGARVVVATAYLHMPPMRSDAGAFERIERAEAEEIARRGAATLEGVTDVQTEVPFGSSLGQALHRVANAEHADLLVVATSYRLRIAGHQLGSVAEQVVHHSPCPVAVVPPQDREPRFSRIGVAVDGTPAARAALEFAYRLADEASGETRKLELLHVLPAPPHIPQPGLTRPAPGHALDREQLEEMAAEVAAYGEVDLVEATGDPAHELVRMSEGLDVLVTGSRDQGAVKRLQLGSVSTHAVRHAVCPVIVVPMRAADRSETTAAEHATA